MCRLSRVALYVYAFMRKQNVRSAINFSNSGFRPDPLSSRPRHCQLGACASSKTAAAAAAAAQSSPVQFDASLLCAVRAHRIRVTGTRTVLLGWDKNPAVPLATSPCRAPTCTPTTAFHVPKMSTALPRRTSQRLQRVGRCLPRKDYACNYQVSHFFIHHQIDLLSTIIARPGPHLWRATAHQLELFAISPVLMGRPPTTARSSRLVQFGESQIPAHASPPSNLTFSIKIASRALVTVTMNSTAVSGVQLRVLAVLRLVRPIFWSSNIGALTLCLHIILAAVSDKGLSSLCGRRIPNRFSNIVWYPNLLLGRLSRPGSQTFVR